MTMRRQSFTLRQIIVQNRVQAQTKTGAPAAGDEKSVLITRGLGGKKNISDVDCCATRLRCTVVKPELINESILKATSPSGIIRKGQGIQIIYGPSVAVIKSNLEDYLETAPNEEYIPETSGDGGQTQGAMQHRTTAAAIRRWGRHSS